MDRATFDEYIAGFNAEDTTAFDRFIAEDLWMINGLLEIHGRQGMKDHYAKIWPDFVETLDVVDFVSDDTRLAIEMKTNFRARHDASEALFGPVVEGDQFDFHGVILYRINDAGQFSHIRVAYNSFRKTGVDGTRTELGLPH